MRALALLALLTLAACGAEGAPKPPADAKPGLHVSGEASFGVTTKG